MTCDDVELRLTEYAREQLGLRERGDVRRHLQGCAACRQALSTSQKLSALLKRPAPKPVQTPAWQIAASFLLLCYWLFGAGFGTLLPGSQPGGQPPAIMAEDGGFLLSRNLHGQDERSISP